MKKRMSVILALTMAATTMFSAVPAMAKDGDVVNITIWSPTDREQVEAWWTEKIAEWNEANPNIQVSREAIDRSDSYAYDNKIATAVTSNDLPDIFYVDGPQVSYYAANGISIPLNDYFTEDDLSDFVPSSIAQNTYDGQLYAIGATESSVAFYYNKDYLKECGVDTDDLDSRTLDNPITWDEMAEIAEKCTTDNYVGTHIIMDHGEGLPYALEPMYISEGKDYISEDGKEADGYVNSEEAVKTTSYLADLIAKGYANIEPITDEFLNGGVAITEAAIRDYAGMYLMKEKGGLVGKLSPKLGQEKIKVETDSFPHRTPWRVISVADRVGGLLETNILTSLNEPCRIEDTSWIKPCRTTFTWWNGNVVPDSTFSPGNNFDTNKYYIDFAARNGLDAHGIYGYAETPWYYDDNFNFGWAGPNADVTKPIPCLNMPRIVEYARSKGVGIHLWVHWRPLYDKLEEAFALYEGWGVKGLMVDFMDRNDQEMIRIQEEILECAARHRLFIQFHGSSKPSGLVRTYPNEFTREGTLNYEVCKWDTLVNADHDIAIPFTRMLAGATDYHLGGFRALPRSEFKIQYVNPHVMSTRCHMLAMYVVLENHLTSLCDTPKAYEGQPGFEVLRTVPGTWDEIRVPLARMNEHVTVARRSGSDWWVGSLNNGTERDLKLELDFLSEGDYQATIYTDAEDVERNPNNLDRQVRKVTRKDIIELNLAKDGGALLHIRRL